MEEGEREEEDKGGRKETGGFARRKRSYCLAHREGAMHL